MISSSLSRTLDHSFTWTLSPHIDPATYLGQFHLRDLRWILLRAFLAERLLGLSALSPLS